jgi:hydrogenase expression/formation protein HypE
MTTEQSASMQFACPVQPDADDQVLLAHGGGGRLAQKLVREVITPALASPWLQHLPDGALINLPPGIAAGAIVMSTDSFVVKPLFFPGGNIGSLAATGTVNDLAMMGARPAWLTCSLIIEEGFAVSDLRRVLRDLAAVARECGAHVVTGDTKVVGRGQGDGLFINTTGVGYQEIPRDIGPQFVRAGDVVILSGDIGRHGTAILCAREDFRIDSPVVSDAGTLWSPVNAMLSAGVPVHCMRDLTRGGLAAALSEISGSAGRPILIHENRIPVSTSVQSVCEIFGLDPINLANEGRFIAVVPEAAVDRTVEILSGFTRPGDYAPAVIGQIGDSNGAGVTLRTAFGGERPLVLPAGDPIPRIC